MMAADSVLLLGDPRLRAPCERVADPRAPESRADLARLAAALDEFRRTHGFGRGIAAPQIGIPRRFIAINLGKGTRCLVNPEIEWRSPETFTMWDDCMSFPELLVRVRRYDSISVRYQDEESEERSWDRLERAESELLQHELDHLDGVLAVDRAIDRESLVWRAAFDLEPELFRAQVDYVIG
jgi:peptide deformylase